MLEVIPFFLFELELHLAPNPVQTLIVFQLLWRKCECRIVPRLIS